MGMVVRTNTMALNAYRQLGMNNSAVSKSLEKLSSGFRINRAGDDAAGLAISEKMKAQIKGLETASANAQDGISLIQTAEGNLNEVHDMLNRMVELSSKSANGTYTTQERKALQDEVDSLLSEIDRISQSANFNGTKLLDGTMGLNKEAFKIAGVDAVKETDGKIDVSSIVAKEADGSPKVHMEGSAVTASTPGAKIDLGDLKVKAAAGAKATVTFTIAGSDYAVELDNSSGSAEKEFTTAEIGTALLAKLKAVDKTTGGAATGGGTNDAIKIGDAVYSVAGTNEITLTYEGRFEGSTFKAETTFAGTKDEATTINGNLGFDVVVKSVASGTQTGGTDVIHKATNVAQAQAAVNATKAGIDIKLTKDLIVEGGKLSIDGKEFTFKVDADSSLTGAGVIDVSKAKTDEERIHMAADLLSKQTVFAGQESRQWKIGVNGDGTTIHIDQTVASASNKELDTYDKLVGVIKATGKAAAAANVGTSITVTNANVKEGDTLSIDGKLYTFSDEKTGTNPDNKATYVAIAGGAAENLKNAISGATINDAKDTVTIRAAKADADAPIVLGRGLTLQIGDTADAFNKMTVSVRDMSPTGLGLKGLSIMTEDDASNAIDKIKTAINTVSTTRAGMGALQNRLEHTINNLDVAVENLSAANSRIRDTDMAKEMMNYTKMNVLVQSAQAMLAQANQQPQSVLQLLQ